MSKQTLYIVDDDQSFVDSLAFMLSNSGYSLSGYTDPVEAIKALENVTVIEPASLLLDVRMPQMSGLELHEHLRAAGLDLPVIYLTGHADVALAVEAMEKGAFTFIEKPVKRTQLVQALTAAFSPTVQCRRLSAQNRLLADERARVIEDLTSREAEVLNGIAEGYTARQIGEALFISNKTVDFHRANIMAKLKVRNLSELHRIVALNSAQNGVLSEPCSGEVRIK